MKKVLIICGASIRISPYAMVYINSALESNCDVSVLVWHRDLIEDVILDKRVNVIDYYDELDDAVPKSKKILHFFRYRKKISSVLKKSSFDCIVVLTTQFTVLIGDILLRKFKNKYVIDMRDISLENFFLFRFVLKCLIKSSKYIFISSDGYRKFLPKSEKIYNLHNFKEDELKYRDSNFRKSLDRKFPIRISFWGCIRDIKIDLDIVEKLKNDERFIVNYYGSMNEESKKLKMFCERNCIKNVFFYGPYNPEDKINFIGNTDLIYNMYSNPDDNGNPLLSNKFYDSLIFKIPQLCNSGGFMGNFVKENNLGLVLTVDDDFVDKIISYYNTYDFNSFKNCCDRVLDKILEEHNYSLSLLQNELKKDI